MALKNYPIRKTGNIDNERTQINRALRDISSTLERASNWDAAVSWGDHNQAGYASELTEEEQFFALGSPQNLTLSQAIEVSPNGTERITVTAAWSQIPDTSVVYDLEIRKITSTLLIDLSDIDDVFAKSELYSVPIVSNEERENNLVTYNIILEPGTGYLFRVRIRRGTLVSPWGNFGSIVTLTADDKPDAPSDPTIQAVIEGAQLAWTLPADKDNIESTIIFRREAGQATDTVVGVVAKPGDTFTDGNLDSSKTYEYSLKTESYRGILSDQTNRVSVTPLQVEADFNTPAVPTGLSQTQSLVTDNTGGQAFVNVDLSWNIVSGDNITYDLDIVRGGSTPVSTPVISNPESGNPNYEFQVPVNTPLAVKVRSRNATAVSAFSGTLSFTADEDSNGVDGVEQVTFTPLYQGALINWVNPDNPNFKYVIVERRREAPSPIDWQVVGTVVRPTSFLFDDVGELSLDANDNVENAYRYKITPYSSAGVAGPSYESPNNSSADWIVPSNIPPDSITADQIVANTITANEINTNNLAADTAFVNALNANTVFVSGLENASSLNVTILADNEPTTRADGSAIKKGDLWYDTNNGNKPYSYDGRVPFSIAGWIPSYTIINGGDITTGTIDASKISVTDLSSINASLGTITAGTITLNTSGFIRSGQTGYNNGTGFFLGKDGATTKFSLGSSTGNRILWDGANFSINGKIINGSNNVVDSSITGTQIDANTITAGNIAAGTITATNINVANLAADTTFTNNLVANNAFVAGTIAAGNIIVTGDNISELANDSGFTRQGETNITIRSALQPTTRPPTPEFPIGGPPLVAGDIWIDTGNGDKPYTYDGTTPYNPAGWIQAYTIIDGGNIETGSISADKISVTNLQALSANTGTLTSNLIRTAASGQRLELTDPTTDATYAIWIGDSTKNDANAVFYVKHNGAAFINKTDFNIETGEVNVGAFSNANTATGGSPGNTLVASSGATPITVGSGGIKFEVNFFFVAATSSNNVADNACPVSTRVSGELELLRNTTNTIVGATSVQTLTFSSPDIREWVEESGGLAPGVCTIRSDTDLIKIFVDTAVTGNYHYFVRFSQWNANSYVNSPVNEVFTNTLYVTWTTGN